ncbi:PadR family transcriptional regulator [Asaia sp. BMEF1]|uniref:PadR family transcriptional regulator n=1 Tax=Asaia sp. BMEF1 TaxID=3155932 RepID=UPI003F66B33E
MTPSPLALAIISLTSEAPMHPYRMHHLLKLRHKTDVINLRLRGTIYQMIARLEQHRLIEISGTQRSESNPERTLYEATDLGRTTALEWLTLMVTSVKNEYPDFPAALSYLTLVEPSDALVLLEKRSRTLESKIKKMTEDLQGFINCIPNVLILENQYSLEIIKTEHAWVNRTISSIKIGSLKWSTKEINEISIEMDRSPC